MYFEEWLAARLPLGLPGYEAQKKMMNINRPHVDQVPDGARQSGVLLILYRHREQLMLVLIERSKDGGVHSGQIAFPGGRMEKSDISVEATALREAFEEVHLDERSITLLGRLSPLYIPVSNFEVHPVIAFSPECPRLIPSEAEVAGIFHFPLQGVFSRKEMVEVKASGSPGLLIRTQAYVVGAEKVIWGATAMILSELESLWNEFNLLNHIS